MITEIDTKEDNANEVVNDKEANQNSLDTSDDDSQLDGVRDVIRELKEMYNEFLLQIKLIQKDLIRSAKYDELESKVSRTLAIIHYFCLNISLSAWSKTVIHFYFSRSQLISTMLELQSLRKEQQRREQLLKIQRDDDCPIEVTVPLRKGIRSGTNQTDELRLNNNRDTLHFEGDANDDDIGTTVADDIILMKGDSNNESTLSSFDNSDTRSTTITVSESLKRQLSVKFNFYV